MTEKESLIARLNDLGAQLGREVSTSGTIQELSMRIAELEEELEEELEGELDSSNGNSGVDTGTTSEVPPLKKTKAPLTDFSLVAVEALATLHIEALHATRDELVSIVEVGSLIRVTEEDATSLVALGLVREQ